MPLLPLIDPKAGGRSPVNNLWNISPPSSRHSTDPPSGPSGSPGSPMAQRPSSWMSEIGTRAPRKPSQSGPLVPFDLTSPDTAKSSRSQSFAEGTNYASPNRGEPNVPQDHTSPNPHAFGSKSGSAAQRLGLDTFSGGRGSVTQSSIIEESPFSPSSPVSARGPAYAASGVSSDFSKAAYANLGSFFTVEFKTHRADVYTTHPQHPIEQELKLGDMVVVDGDRGWDLGQIVFVTKSPPEAEAHAKYLNNQHLEALVRYSQGYQSYFPKLKLHHGLDGPRIKYVRKIATPAELHNLATKEHFEAKAKRLAQQKASERGYQLEILDTEYQGDLQKCTVYYFAPVYIVFNDLVQDLYKSLKVRLWMSNVTVNNSTSNRQNTSPLANQALPAMPAYTGPPGPSQQGALASAWPLGAQIPPQYMDPRQIGPIQTDVRGRPSFSAEGRPGVGGSPVSARLAGPSPGGGNLAQQRPGAEYPRAWASPGSIPSWDDRGDIYGGGALPMPGATRSPIGDGFDSPNQRTGAYGDFDGARMSAAQMYGMPPEYWRMTQGDAQRFSGIMGGAKPDPTRRTPSARDDQVHSPTQAYLGRDDGDELGAVERMERLTLDRVTSRGSDRRSDRKSISPAQSK